VILPSRASAPDHAVFYFDFRDPYAYLVATRVPRLCVEAGTALTLMPIDSMSLGHEGGLMGHGASSSVRDYVWQDIERTAERLGTPFHRPHHYPFDSELLLRTCLYIRDRSGQEAMHAVADSLWHAVWERGEDPEALSTAVRAGREVALPESAIRSVKEDARLGEMLQRTTRRAVERGVDVVPTVDVEGRLFSGFEDMGHLEAALRGAHSLSGPPRGPGGDAGGGGGSMPDWTFSG
jgi:2-hydroxychromene-2-carboxylate isomerase